MTNIYIYCLFDTSDELLGVYSSLKAVHRDALKLANRGTSRVRLVHGADVSSPSLTRLRNIFKGKCETEVKYRTHQTMIRVFKTRLKE